MDLGLPLRRALHDRKRRTEVPEPSNFVLTLTQADALGMPMGRVLKTSAEEMRSTFPAIFALQVGPAASDIGGAFGA